MLRIYYVFNLIVIVLFTNISALCQSPTFNLNSLIQTSQIPIGATLEVYNSYPLNISSKLSSFESLVPGKYYAVFNFGNGCLSEVTPITILTNQCPRKTIDLSKSFENLIYGSNLIISYHSALPISDNTKLSQIQVDSASFGVYYVAFQDKNTLCYSNPSPIIFIETDCCPTMPTITNNSIKVCYGDSVNLVANCIAGNELWFTDSLLVSPSFENVKVKPETTTSYFAVCNQYDCNSPYVKLNVDVTKIPKPDNASFFRCGVGNISLTGSGCLGQIKWYDNMEIDTSFSSSNPLNIITLNDSRYYYATCLDQSCESSRAEIHAVVNKIPSIDLIAASPTCVGLTSKSNGLILASRFYSSDKFQLNLGDTFDIVLASSEAIIPSNGVLKNDINVLNKEKYTIRIISGEGCHKDHTVEIENNCSDCQIDYCKVPEVVKTN